MISPPEFQALLEKWKLLPAVRGRVAAFRFVRDIHYGDIGSRNPFDVLQAKKGTCSGKHALLKLFLEGLGYKVQTFFALHDFSKFPVSPWPESLLSFQSKTLTDYHDFLKVQIGDAWLTVDAIFDAPLLSLGFPITDWDGVRDVSLPIVSESIIPAVGDPEEHKKELIAALPASVQKDRKEFLQALTAFIDENRP